MQQFIPESVYYFIILKMLLYYKKVINKQDKVRSILFNFYQIVNK